MIFWTLRGEKGLYAESVVHVGLSCKLDEEIWNYALEHDFTVVTTNARDFIRLLNVELHPGLIVLRESGLTRDERLHYRWLLQSAKRVRAGDAKASTYEIAAAIGAELSICESTGSRQKLRA